MKEQSEWHIMSNFFSQLAALLVAGLQLNDAWKHLAHDEEAGFGSCPDLWRFGQHTRVNHLSCWVILQVAREGDSRRQLHEAITEATEVAQRGEMLSLRAKSGQFGEVVSAWREFSGIIGAALSSGAPLAEALVVVNEALEARMERNREVAAAVAGPFATVKLLTLLPFLGLAMTTVLGMGAVQVLFTTGVGVACLMGGIVLAGTCWLWSAHYMRIAQRRVQDPGLLFEIVRMLVASGSDVASARTGALRALGISGQVSDAPRESLRRLDGLIGLSQQTGMPVGAILRSQTRQLRKESVFTSLQKARKLETQLLLPIGFCALPSFMVLSVVPVAIALYLSTFTGF